MNALLMQALRREAQNHFARRMSQVAVSDWTSQERAEGERLGFCRRLPVVAAPRPMPERVTYRALEMMWW